ncbi:hypothetical protein BDF19DRAFT_447356 [Syncephalis fuscata]|nr:hypothetical protein BDF19DRAFT_447356 [Syncephalis fuscata]
MSAASFSLTGANGSGLVRAGVVDGKLAGVGGVATGATGIGLATTGIIGMSGVSEGTAESLLGTTGAAFFSVLTPCLGIHAFNSNAFGEMDCNSRLSIGAASTP